MVGSDQHRHALRVCAGLCRDHDSALQGSGATSAIQGAAGCLVAADDGGGLLSLPDVLPAADIMVAVCRLADDWAFHLFCLTAMCAANWDKRFGRIQKTPSVADRLTGLGSFLIAIGLLTIQHGHSLGELFAMMSTSTTDGIRAIVALSVIGVGLLCAVAGVIMGAGVSSQQSK